MSVTTSQPSRGSYLMPSRQHATVSDAMHPGILACEPDASLPEVARFMATHHAHCVAVVGVSHEEPTCGVGSVISDLDLIRVGIRDGEAPSARDRAAAAGDSGAVVALREAGELCWPTASAIWSSSSPERSTRSAFSRRLTLPACSVGAARSTPRPMRPKP